MGHKTNPLLFRISSNKNVNWSSDWYTNTNQSYASCIVEDAKIYSYFDSAPFGMHIGSISIDRKSDIPHVVLKAAKVSLVAGKMSKNLDTALSYLMNALSKKVTIEIVELKRPDLNAGIVAKNCAEKIKKRLSYKRVAKMAIDAVIRAGATGVKITVSGRLNGAEIARSEVFKQGPMPLHSMRARVDYAIAESCTTYGIIGIKVWIYVTGKIRIY